MTMTSPITPEINGREALAIEGEAVLIAERIKQKARTRRLGTARSLAARLQTLPDGSHLFVRFSRAQCLEHQILMVTFTLLTVTGLLQRYSQFSLIGLIINVLGNIDTFRTLHHLTAMVFILETVYHGLQILALWFVKRERGGMWPYLRDFRDLVQMVSFNLGLAKERPEFDRFSIEEKLEYWALLWGTPLMILTGLVMWFPTIVTSVLPGDAIPISRAIHGWEAILAALAILTWHMYHTILKERNHSIFTGVMTEREMQHLHPLEYRRILAAHEFLQKMATEKSTGEDNRIDTEVVLEEARYEVV
ncbi:MAG: cytochrome b/b6 domain-containing protein [Chloroflexota bacterium]